MAEPSPLVSFIRDKIRRHGPIPFSWFMEQALYHPEFGYYSSMRCRIGLEGDFYTNVTVSRLYGQLLSLQLIEMWKLLGMPKDFSIVEEGAEDGQLAQDILSEIKAASEEAAASICYTIVEPIFIKQQQQRERLESQFPGKVKWLTGLADTAPIVGVFISNELVDAMPVHIVQYESGALVRTFSRSFV